MESPILQIGYVGSCAPLTAEGKLVGRMLAGASCDLRSQTSAHSSPLQVTEECATPERYADISYVVTIPKYEIERTERGRIALYGAYSGVVETTCC